MLLDVDIALSVGGFALEASLSLDRGVLVLFGPSGAGKSLTVSALAGLVRPERGSIRLAGRTLFDAAGGIDVPTHQRGVGYVPQHHSLFPFLDVAHNVAFGLPRARRRRDDPAVVALLEELELTHLADARPASLSGGERQRVAFARALAVEPKILLLDEPFASIDRAGRQRVRGTLKRVLARRGIPAVLVTHDPNEARALGDTVVLFERGRTVRSGHPDALLGGREILVEGTMVRGDDGSLRLTDAVVQGAEGLMDPGEDGRMRLRIPVPDPGGDSSV